MADTTGFLDQLELAIVNRLQAWPELDDVTVLHMEQKQILDKLNQELAKLNIVCVVWVHQANDADPNIGGVLYRDIAITIGIYRQPIIGATKKTARYVAEQVNIALKGWTPDNLANNIKPSTPTVEFEPNEQLVIWNVHLSTLGGFKYAMTQIATPTVVQDTTPASPSYKKLTLACATPGAVMFWTQNGKTPMPLTATGPGNLYTIPFVPTPAVAIKVRAFLAGYLNSEIVTMTPI